MKHRNKAEVVMSTFFLHSNYKYEKSIVLFGYLLVRCNGSHQTMAWKQIKMMSFCYN